MKILENFTTNKYGLDVRLVNEDDAEFILQLRTDPILSTHLNSTTYDIDLQRSWLADYKTREESGNEFYFVFSKNNIDLGLERIYNITSDSFIHGSLIFKHDSPLGSSIIADIITREIGFELLNLSINYFDVRKGNNNVIIYHNTFQSEIIREDSDNFYFKLEKDKFIKNKMRYIKKFSFK